MGSPPPEPPTGLLPVALLLPGQGAQHAGMACGLYNSEPAFTDAVDEVFALLGAEGDRIRDDWTAERPAVPLDHVSRAQPLLFAVDYALGRMLLDWGIRPAVLLGHSAGEAAAAALAGVFDLPDAVRLLAERVELIDQAPPGGMLAVAATPSEVTPHLAPGVVVGAVNSSSQLLLAGPEPELGATLDALHAAGLTCVRAGATAGFHSPSLAEVCARQIPSVAAVPRHPPAIPVLSGYTAELLSPKLAADPEFWAMQPAEPVLFGPALDRLLDSGPYQLVEAGPGQSLSALARRHRGVTRGGSKTLGLLPARPGDPARDRESVREAARRLFADGHVTGSGPPGSTQRLAGGERTGPVHAGSIPFRGAVTTLGGDEQPKGWGVTP